MPTYKGKHGTVIEWTDGSPHVLVAFRSKQSGHSAVVDMRDLVAFAEGVGWTATSDDVPPISARVLVRTTSGEIKLAERSGTFSWPAMGYTHWRPLPAPPTRG